MGAIKITTDKFYRINGESVQLEGVKSDIVIPDSYMHIFNGERDEKNPLKWDKIDPAYYTAWNGFKNFSLITNNAQNRVNSNNYLQLISKRADWIKEQRDNKAKLKADKVKKVLEIEKETRIKELENKKIDIDHTLQSIGIKNNENNK